MGEGRQRAAWDQTVAVMGAWIGKAALKAHPLRKIKRPEPDIKLDGKESVKVLASVFGETRRAVQGGR